MFILVAIGILISLCFKSSRRYALVALIALTALNFGTGLEFFHAVSRIVDRLKLHRPPFREDLFTVLVLVVFILLAFWIVSFFYQEPESGKMPPWAKGVLVIVAILVVWGVLDAKGIHPIDWGRRLAIASDFRNDPAGAAERKVSEGIDALQKWFK